MQDKGKAETESGEPGEGQKKETNAGPAVSQLIRLWYYRYRLKIVRTLENCCIKKIKGAVVYRKLVYQATDFCRYKNSPEIKIVNFFFIFSK
jgi:hypothetical protein